MISTTVFLLLLEFCDYYYYYLLFTIDDWRLLATDYLLSIFYYYYYFYDYDYSSFYSHSYYCTITITTIITIWYCKIPMWEQWKGDKFSITSLSNPNNVKTVPSATSNVKTLQAP